MSVSGQSGEVLSGQTINRLQNEVEKLQAEVERLSFERDEALRILGEKIAENEQIIEIHSEQAICAESFATTMAENVLLSEIVYIYVDRGQCMPNHLKTVDDVVKKFNLEE